MTRSELEREGRGPWCFSVSLGFAMGRERTNGEAGNVGRIHAAEAQW